MTKTENKCLTCRQLLIQNCNNFHLVEYYNFSSRSEAKSAFKKALTSVERKAKEKCQLKTTISRFSKEDYKTLDDININTFWEKRTRNTKRYKPYMSNQQLKSKLMRPYWQI